MIENRIIPISQIEQYYNIKVQSPPPYRNQLGIQEDVLVSAVKTLKLRDIPIRINFFRNEPKVSIAPDGTGGISVATHAVVAEKEKQKPPSFVTMDFSGNVVMMLPYRDNETTNPEKTAAHTSKELQKALQRIPGILYLYDVLEIYDTNGITDASKEVILSTACTIGNVFNSALVGAYAKFLLGQEIPLSYGEWSLLCGVLSYTLFAIILLREARKYKKNKEEDPNNFLAAYISENPKRAFYPVKFIEELVVPSALYWFQQMSENNIIVPLSTPTVR